MRKNYYAGDVPLYDNRNDIIGKKSTKIFFNLIKVLNKNKK
jgi:hypothetical protein